MNLKTTLLGLCVVIAACVAIALQILYVNETITLAGWGLTLLIAVTWAALNRRLVLGFLTHKSTRTGANVALVIFLVLGCLVFLNVIAHTHPLRKDLTRNGLNTLSEQSKKIVGALTQDVTAYYFQNLSGKDKGEDVLKRYTYVNPHFKYEFVDIDRRPTLAAAMGVKRPDTVVLSLSETKKISVEKPTEEAVTNGLLKLFHVDQITVYFTTGHEEHALDDDRDTLGYSFLKSEIGKQGYNVKELNLFSEGKVPADAGVVIVGGPKKAFFPKELEILGNWIKDGGHAVLAVDLDIAESGLSKGSRQVAELLKPYGVTVMSQMLVDPTSKQTGVEPQVLLGFSGSKDHAITKDFPFSSRAANFLFPLTTYLVGDEKAGLLTPLVVTTELAWAESDWASLKKGTASFDPATDHRGKMVLAYAIEAKKPSRTRIVAFANAMFADNTLLDKVGNRDLILNAVAWLAGDENFISIRPVDEHAEINAYNSAVLSLILYVTVGFVPLLLIVAGTVVWWRRGKL